MLLNCNLQSLLFLDFLQDYVKPWFAHATLVANESRADEEETSRICVLGDLPTQITHSHGDVANQRSFVRFSKLSLTFQDGCMSAQELVNRQ